MNKNILISGINGQDGAFLAEIAISQGYSVVGIQRPKKSSHQEIQNLKYLKIFDQLIIEVVNLEDQHSTNSLVKKYQPSLFAHLGSQSLVTNSRNLKKDTFNSNYISTLNVINSLNFYSKDTSFFFPSSATIFEGYADCTVNEKTKPKPKTFYAKSKFETHEMIEQLNSDLNLFLNVGIMFSHESEFRREVFFTKKVVKFLSNYVLDRNQKLFLGDLKIYRDIGYAKEYSDAIFKILLNRGSKNYIVSKNQLYLLSDFLDTSLSLFEINFEKYETKNKIEYIDLKTGKIFIISEKSRHRKDDLRNIKGNNSKIKKELNWQPRTDLIKLSEIMVNFEKKINK